MKILHFFVIIIVFPITLWSDWSYRYTTRGQWEIIETNFGVFGGLDNWHGYWPRGTGHNYIYGAGIWNGGMLPNGDTVVTTSYNPHGEECEGSPGTPYSNPLDDQWHVWFSTDPAYPFVPISAEDGYAIYNDFDTTYHMPDSFHVREPLGITITQKTYVYPMSWADDVVFMKFIVKNDTTYTISDFYSGFCMDFDIGNEAVGNCNDRCGVDLQRKLFYGWQEEDEPLWDWRGMLGLKLLSSQNLASFKRFTFDSEPTWDWQRYMTMAGYNYTTGLYEPYDTIWPPPDDQRIVMSCGPISSWLPGDSLVFDWALIASHDLTPPCSELVYKADKAQACYDAGWHSAQILAPNGSEVVLGTYNITYTANSVTSNPLMINIYLESSSLFDTIALEQSNTGSYDWNTTLWPDGVFYKISIIAYDTITFGYDVSDACFVINNPGNTAPILQVFSPENYDTLAENYDIRWCAADPEFLDSLPINIYFKSQYDSSFQLIADNELNDSLWTWNTYPYRNGSGILIIETHDEEFTIAETIQVDLFNQLLAGEMSQIFGLNNTLNLSLHLHQPAQIAGHTYELKFMQYQAQAGDAWFYPEYIYEIRDSNTGVVVLDSYSLRDSYTLIPPVGIMVNDFSPIVEGFSIRAYTIGYDAMVYWNFTNDSANVVIGNYPADSISFVHGPTFFTWWAYRGSRLQLDWTSGGNGGLTLFVTDLDYGDTIPYKPYGPWNNQNSDSAFGWCFRPSFGSSGTPSDTLRGTDQYIYLCGDRIHFSRSIPAPQAGDQWIVYPSAYHPPIKGNVYHFTPTGINEYNKLSQTMSFQVYPIPFTENIIITYSVPKRQLVKIVVYDILGRKIRMIKDGLENPGAYNIAWNGSDDRNRKISAGVYFCRFVTENYADTKKLVLVR